MEKRTEMRKILLALLLLVAPAFATTAPVLFFTDLTDGPNSGNSDTTFSATGGVYVTLYGNFLDSFTSVTLNGSSCLTVVSNPATWMWYERMVVKVGTTCATGNFVVTTAAGTSNGIPFTVRAGNIRYIATTGNDGNAGTFASPYLTMLACISSVQSPPDGHICYAENGVHQDTIDARGWGAISCSIEWCNTTSSGFNTVLAAYPGATVTAGTTSLAGLAFRDTDCTATPQAGQGFFTLAEINLRATSDALGLQGNAISEDHTKPPFNSDCNTRTGKGSQHWRFVAIDASCPSGSGSDACLHTGNIGEDATTGLIDNFFYGMNWHRIGAAQPGGPDDQYHGMYYGDNSSGYELGWSQISDVVGCRGLQVYSNDFNEYLYKIHDNSIWSTTCDGIVASVTDPSLGAVSIYNNVLWLVGQGPPTFEGGGTFTGIFIARTNQFGSYQGTPGVAGPAGSGNFAVFFNTLYSTGNIVGTGESSCNTRVTGLALDDDPGGGTPNAQTAETGTIYSNVVSETSKASPCTGGIPYWLSGPGASFLTGNKNLTFGLTCSPNPCSSAQVTNSVTTDPLFTSTSTTGCPASCATNLHLSSAGSPANGTGVTTGPPFIPTYDHDGVVRPSPPSIGAYEFAAGTGPPPSNPGPSRLFAGSIIMSKGNYEQTSSDMAFGGYLDASVVCRITGFAPQQCSGTN
jgi:hypothetical protein